MYFVCAKRECLFFRKGGYCGSIQGNHSCWGCYGHPTFLLLLSQEAVVFFTPLNIIFCKQMFILCSFICGWMGVAAQPLLSGISWFCPWTHHARERACNAQFHCTLARCLVSGGQVEAQCVCCCLCFIKLPPIIATPYLASQTPICFLHLLVYMIPLLTILLSHPGLFFLPMQDVFYQFWSPFFICGGD